MDDGACTLVSGTWSVLSDSSHRTKSHEFCIVNEFRGTRLELDCSTASTTANLTSMCWPKMEIMATTNWSMIDEWSLALTLALQQMLTEVFTAQKIFPLSRCMLTARFLCQAWMDSPVFTAPTGRRHMNLAHDSGRCQRADLERKSQFAGVSPRKGQAVRDGYQERGSLPVRFEKHWHRWVQRHSRTKVIHVPISQERVVGAHPIVSALRTALGAKPIQEAARTLPTPDGTQRACAEKRETTCESGPLVLSIEQEQFFTKPMRTLTPTPFFHPLILGIIFTGVQTVEPTGNGCGTGSIWIYDLRRKHDRKTVASSEMRLEIAMLSGTTTHFKAATHLTDARGTCPPLHRRLQHQLVSPTFFEEREQCNVSNGTLILMNTRRKNKNGWKKLVCSLWQRR